MLNRNFALTIALLSFLSISFCCRGASIHRIEAEDLKGDSGWNLGVGKFHSMGKVQVAMKKGIQISGSYQLPAAGTYQIWVRTNTLGQGWRIGQLLINGKEAGIFGDDPVTPERKKGSWYWKKLSPCKLTAGKCDIQIRSPKGFARIDCLLLADDPAFIPPANRDQTEKISALKQIR